jgi:hypothetical protein
MSVIEQRKRRAIKKAALEYPLNSDGTWLIGNRLPPLINRILMFCLAVAIAAGATPHLSPLGGRLTRLDGVSAQTLDA